MFYDNNTPSLEEIDESEEKISFDTASGKGCHHDTLLHIWFCNSCSSYRFWLIFFLINKSRSQAALVQVSNILLNSHSRTRVKCEKIFCVSWGQITSHNDTPSCHDDKHLKSIGNSEVTMIQPVKNFHTKRFCTSDRNAAFVVLFQFLFTMIVYRKQCLILQC